MLNKNNKELSKWKNWQEFKPTKKGKKMIEEINNSIVIKKEVKQPVQAKTKFESCDCFGYLKGGE